MFSEMTSVQAITQVSGAEHAVDELLALGSVHQVLLQRVLALGVGAAGGDGGVIDGRGLLFLGGGHGCCCWVVGDVRVGECRR